VRGEPVPFVWAEGWMEFLARFFTLISYKRNEGVREGLYLGVGCAARPGRGVTRCAGERGPIFG
jgi:hypothetical protein